MLPLLLNSAMDSILKHRYDKYRADNTFPPEAQKPFIDLVDQILEITSAFDYDPKNSPAKQKELEIKIDQAVYEAYGLTDSEKATVEESVI